MQYDKKYFWFLSICLILFLGFMGVIASEQSDVAPTDELQRVSQEEVDALEQEKREMIESIVNAPPPVSFYDSYYSKANEQQKEKLNQIMEDNSITLIGFWVRDVLIAMQELPEDTPRLTLKDAEEVAERADITSEADILNALNKKAGIHDWEGGSGIYRYFYFLNDERTECISVSYSSIIYTAIDESGNSIFRILGEQIDSRMPSSSYSPGFNAGS